MEQFCDFTEDELKVMKRRDLLSICKQYSIKAVGTNADMIAKIIEIRRSQQQLNTPDSKENILEQQVLNAADEFQSLSLKSHAGKPLEKPKQLKSILKKSSSFAASNPNNDQSLLKSSVLAKGESDRGFAPLKFKIPVTPPTVADPLPVISEPMPSVQPELDTIADIKEPVDPSGAAYKPFGTFNRLFQERSTPQKLVSESVVVARTDDLPKTRLDYSFTPAAQKISHETHQVGTFDKATMTSNETMHSTIAVQTDTVSENNQPISKEEKTADLNDLVSKFDSILDGMDTVFGDSSKLAPAEQSKSTKNPKETSSELDKMVYARCIIKGAFQTHPKSSWGVLVLIQGRRMLKCGDKYEEFMFQDAEIATSILDTQNIVESEYDNHVSPEMVYENHNRITKPLFKNDNPKDTKNIVAKNSGMRIVSRPDPNRLSGSSITQSPLRRKSSVMSNSPKPSISKTQISASPQKAPKSPAALMKQSPRKSLAPSATPMSKSLLKIATEASALKPKFKYLEGNGTSDTLLQIQSNKFAFSQSQPSDQSMFLPKRTLPRTPPQN